MPNPPDLSTWRFPNAATPVGSPSYYAIRFSASQRRDRYAMLLAWFAQIGGSGERPRDPGATRLKLEWWRDELDRIRSGAPSHPLAIEMQNAGLRRRNLLRHLHAAIDATEDEVCGLDESYDRAFVDRCSRLGAARFLALGGLETPVVDESRYRAAGGLCELVERLRLAVATPWRLPPGLRPDALAGLDSTTRAHRIETLLQPFADVDRDMARTTLSDVTARLTLIGLTLQRRMQRLDYPIQQRSIERLPIAYLWQAWRCR